jgi:hypothetical protein
MILLDNLGGVGEWGVEIGIGVIEISVNIHIFDQKYGCF